MSKGTTLKPATHGYSHVIHRKRSKCDWAGVSLGDAFRHNLDYWLRLQAQRSFYKETRRAQQAVAKLAGLSVPHQPQVKPQITPCFTSYPNAAAALAAIGLTAFLEYKECSGGGSALYLHCKDEKSWFVESLPDTPYENMLGQISTIWWRRYRTGYF